MTDKMKKMIAFLKAQDHLLAEEIGEALVAAERMRSSVSLVRAVGKTIVEIRDEEAFVTAAKDFSDLMI